MIRRYARARCGADSWPSHGRGALAPYADRSCAASSILAVAGGRGRSRPPSGSPHCALGCTGHPHRGRSAAPTTTTTQPPPTTTTTRRRGVAAATGDLRVRRRHPLRGQPPVQARLEPGGMFGPIAPELPAADVAMVNLETAITERGPPEPKKFNFRAPARAFDALQGAGVDVVTMANNHGVDYGPEGLADTLAAKAADAARRRRHRRERDRGVPPWRTEVQGSAHRGLRRDRRDRRLADPPLDRDRHAGRHRVGEGRRPSRASSPGP